jgi:hypothetical protein
MACPLPIKRMRDECSCSSRKRLHYPSHLFCRGPSNSHTNPFGSKRISNGVPDSADTSVLIKREPKPCRVVDAVGEFDGRDIESRLHAEKEWRERLGHMTRGQPEDMD